MPDYSRGNTDIPYGTGASITVPNPDTPYGTGTQVNLPTIAGGGTWEIVLVAAGATLVTQFLRPLLDLVIEQFRKDAKDSDRLQEVLSGKLDTMGEERRAAVAEMQKTCMGLQTQQREIIALLRKLL